MPKVLTAVERIDGWKGIAGYLGKDVTTVIRWEKLKGLPIHRVPGGQRHAVFAWRHEIDQWLESGCNGSNGHRPSAIANEESPQAVEKPAHVHAQPSRIWLRANARWLRWTTVVVTVLAACGFAVHSLTTPRRIQFTGIAQLTSDGAPKDGLVTVGEQLYFGEERDGGVVVSKVSVAGGQVRTIPTPFVNATPEGISPDGKQLLVLDREGEEREHALWIVPTDGGEPYHAGKVLCHSAAWSPDGYSIAFANGNGIFLTSDEGVTAQEVQAVAGVPQLLRWSRDGKQLRFSLEEGTERSSLWELAFRGEDGPQVASLIPLHVSFDRNLRSFAVADDAGRSFLSIDGPLDNRIWFLEKSWGEFGLRFIPIKLDDQLAYISGLSLDRTTRTLFALSGVNGGTELLGFSRATGDFKPFLPGISARDVDYSRDGQWIVYVETRSKSLWISRTDGSQRRQIDFQASDMELPRWSPDGRWIAFMAKRPDTPWRIFIVPAAGGIPKEASAGSDNQGAPTWSPDGRWLMYGNVNCEELGTCAIHKIDLSTGQVITLPGSEGMGTARWSPDGRYVAALYPERRQVYALDLKTERWRKLADGVNGNDLAWSADSRYVYASRPIGDKPEIFRIGLSEEKVESAIDLSAFSKLPGRVDTWFCLAPDGSIVFMRWLDRNEVYALHYQEI